MWQILLCVGIGFFILEIFTPGMFFLNFAIGAIISSIIAVYYPSVNVAVISFALLSILSLIILRPILIKNLKKDEQKTGIEEKYIGKTAKITEKIDDENYKISIYGEVWQAKSQDGEIFEINDTIEIAKNESIVMYIKRVNK